MKEIMRLKGANTDFEPPSMPPETAPESDYDEGDEGEGDNGVSTPSSPQAVALDVGVTA